MDRTTRRKIIRWLTVALVVAAFANSYRHGLEWALAHSPAHEPNVWAAMIAALPELIVIIVVLGFPENRWGIRTLIPGGLAVGWTLWGNGSAAAHGISGLFIALSPAIVSLLGLWLSHAQPEPAQSEPNETAQPAQSGPPTVPTAVPEPEPKVAQRLKVAASSPPRPRVSTPVGTAQPDGPRARGLAWATHPDRLGTVPTLPDLMAPEPAGPGLSRATAQRVLAVVSPRVNKSDDPSHLRENGSHVQ